ncbi:MAG: hypothetical protein WA150_11455, partial [Methylovirgula sp.]
SYSKTTEFRHRHITPRGRFPRPPQLYRNRFDSPEWGARSCNAIQIFFAAGGAGANAPCAPVASGAAGPSDFIVPPNLQKNEAGSLTIS